MRVPNTFAVLGDLVDMRVDRDGKILVMRIPRYVLGSDTARRAVWLIQKPEKKKPLPLEGLEEAGKVYRSWSQFKPRDAYAAKVTASPATPTKRLGTVLSIAYRTDKWSGKRTTYQHDFRDPPILEKSGNIYRLRGGQVRVTAAGITG